MEKYHKRNRHASMMGIMHKITTVLLSVILFCFYHVPSVSASIQVQVNRLGGSSRYSTAVAIAKDYQPGSCDNIVLTSGNEFADALSAGPLAHQLNAPVLLSATSASDSSDSLAYIRSHLSSSGTVYVIGGTGSVPSSITNAISTNVRRISGADRYATNLAVVEVMHVKKGTPLVFASGEDYPDALSVAGFAGHDGFPIILVGSQGLTSDQLDYVENDSPTHMYFIGGPAPLPLSVQTTLSEKLPSASILRLAGNDRFETAEAVDKAFAAKPSMVYLTNGFDFADALAASSIAARDNAPLVFEDPTRVGAPLAMDKYLNSVYKAGDSPKVVALGGEQACPSWIVSEVNSTLLGHIPTVLAQYNTIGTKDFVKLSDFVPCAFYDIRYATTNNFTKTQLYPSSYVPTVRKDMALRLAAVEKGLLQKGYRLAFWDSWRPASAQRKMWDIDPNPNYIANPAGWGSNHEHGGAVDVTLVDGSGHEIDMPTPFDDNSYKAGRDYSVDSATERRNALILQDAMQAQGFVGLSTEWWHYDDQDVANDALAPTVNPVSLPEPAAAPQATITISATGDNTLANGFGFGYDGSVANYYNNYGGSYFYKYVHNILAESDLSLGNLEGVLTNATDRVGKSSQGDEAFWFKGSPDYARTILKNAPYDAVDVANNHSDDYLSTGFNDTVKALASAGIGYFGYGHMYTTTKKNIKIAVLGYNVIGDVEQYIDPGDNTKLTAGREQQIISKMQTDVAKAKEDGYQIIIVFYHWGTEGNYGVDQYQKDIGHATVDAGANLVLGAHPHVLEPTETYEGVPIVYSLGNFVFGGNYSPSDYNSEISKTTFKFVNGQLQSEVIKEVPCQISSTTEYNNFQPVLNA